MTTGGRELNRVVQQCRKNFPQVHIVCINHFARQVRHAFERNIFFFGAVFEGVNDIGGSWNPAQTADELISSFTTMIEKAHSHGLKIIGATIMPFKGNNYYNEQREQARQKVNQWIRTGGMYDGVIDFDRIMSDPAQSDRLNPTYLFENDWLHPNADGYLHMGEGIDLELFR